MFFQLLTMDSVFQAPTCRFVFEKRFYRRQRQLYERSTGMGLYLVKEMAMDLAIDLQITSELKVRYNSIFDIPERKIIR